VLPLLLVRALLRALLLVDGPQLACLLLLLLLLLPALGASPLLPRDAIWL
jgi:hypothetical protein